MRRNKLVSQQGEADRYIWLKCITKTEDYEGIPESLEEQKKWFTTNELGKNHIRRAVAGLMSEIGEVGEIDASL